MTSRSVKRHSTNHHQNALLTLLPQFCGRVVTPMLRTKAVLRLAATCKRLRNYVIHNVRLTRHHEENFRVFVHLSRWGDVPWHFREVVMDEVEELDPLPRTTIAKLARVTSASVVLQTPCRQLDGYDATVVSNFRALEHIGVCGLGANVTMGDCVRWLQNHLHASQLETITSLQVVGVLVSPSSSSSSSSSSPALAVCAMFPAVHTLNLSAFGLACDFAEIGQWDLGNLQHLAITHAGHLAAQNVEANGPALALPLISLKLAVNTVTSEFLAWLVSWETLQSFDIVSKDKSALQLPQGRLRTLRVRGNAVIHDLDALRRLQPHLRTLRFTHFQDRVGDVDGPLTFFPTWPEATSLTLTQPPQAPLALRAWTNLTELTLATPPLLHHCPPNAEFWSPVLRTCTFLFPLSSQTKTFHARVKLTDIDRVEGEAYRGLFARSCDQLEMLRVHGDVTVDWNCAPAQFPCLRTLVAGQHATISPSLSSSSSEIREFVWCNHSRMAPRMWSGGFKFQSLTSLSLVGRHVDAIADKPVQSALSVQNLPRTLTRLTLLLPYVLPHGTAFADWLPNLTTLHVTSRDPVLETEMIHPSWPVAGLHCAKLFSRSDALQRLTIDLVTGHQERTVQLAWRHFRDFAANLACPQLQRLTIRAKPGANDLDLKTMFRDFAERCSATQLPFCPKLDTLNVIPRAFVPTLCKFRWKWTPRNAMKWDDFD